MAYDERLADELRERLVGAEVFFEEKRMFGGLAFLVEGNLTIAASRQGGLLVRTDPDEAEEILELAGVEPMEPAGRRMPGWVFVAPEALGSEDAVDAWLQRGLAFVGGLPPK